MPPFPPTKCAIASSFLGDWDYIQNNGREIFQEESGQGAILRTGNGISQAFRKLDARGWKSRKLMQRMK
jgi:hypothetical protein